MKRIKKVLIFGGTHGNEWTGIKIVEQYSEYFQNKFPELSLEFIIANPIACELNQRFKDEDLNRAFQFLNETRPNSYEHKRALELRDKITSEDCFVIDLHTTTSNMGKTLILSDENPLNLQISSLIKEKFADCRVILAPDPNHKYLSSQGPWGLIIEVGPTPNGIVHPLVIEGTLLLLEEALKGISSFPIHQKGSLEVYEEVENVFYPQNQKGEISSYIHSDFQGKDFEPVEGKFTPFKSFSGSEIHHQVREKLYPIFINEAAYYPQQLAFILCRKKILTF